MRFVRSFFLTALPFTLALAAALPSRASADVTVIVLGIRSMEGDDEFARSVTGALRHAASQVDGWNVTDREVTLEQMALAHDCDEPNPECLAGMATTLGVQRILYGDVRRTGAGERFDFSLSLHIYNAETGQIERSVTDTVNQNRRDIDDLREPVRRWMSELSGTPRSGSLRVSVNVPNAEVFVDGESVGHADDQGNLLIPDVSAGNHNIRITAEGHRGFRSTVSVEAFGESSFEAELEVGSDPGSGGGGGVDPQLIAGIGLLAGGAILGALWIWSMAEIAFNLQNNADFTAYRDAYKAWYDEMPDATMMDLYGENVCRAAREANIDPATRDGTISVCNTADTLEILEYVFLIAGAAALGVGSYFLVSSVMGGGGSDSASQASFRLVPSVGTNRASLTGILTF